MSNEGPPVKRRLGSKLVMAALVVGATVAVLQPSRVVPVEAAPSLAPNGAACTTVATTTGATTALGTVVTSSVSTGVVTITATSTTWLPGPWIEVPFPPYSVPGPPVLETVPWIITGTTTTTAPVTETTTSTGITTGYVTATVACPATTAELAATADQTSAVSGLVSGEQGQPLVGVVVTVGGSTTVTDAGGHFLVSNLPAGSYVVSVRYPGGYTAVSPSSATVALDGSNRASLDFSATGGPADPAFRPFWVETFRPAPLQSGTDGRATTFATLPQWSFLLVVQPEVGGWLDVYNPATHNVGFIQASMVGPSGAPH
jgi:hypothetical protein